MHEMHVHLLQVAIRFQYLVSFSVNAVSFISFSMLESTLALFIRKIL